MKPSSLVAVLLAVACGGSNRSQFDPAGPAALLQLTPSFPAEGEVVPTRTVTFSGRTAAPPGTRVSVAALDGALGTHLCTATVAGDQTWSCAQKLPDGGYTWTAQIAPGAPSAGIDFVVSTAGSPAPTIDATPSPTNDPSPTLTGTISVCGDEDCDADVDDNDGFLVVSEKGQTLCTLHPFNAGAWACKLSSKLADGPHVLTAVVSFAGISSPSSNPDVFVVKTSVGAPTVNSVPTPTNLNQIVFSGTGEPGATITVSESGNVICQATVRADGTWSCTSNSLPDGSHTVSVTQTDAAGNVSSAAQVTFVIDTHVPLAPTLDPPRTPTSDPNVTLTGTGEAGDQVFVFDALSHPICSARVSAAGKWSCTPAPLADGDYLFTAFQVTPAGNKSGPSQAQPLSVRTLQAPTFDAPISPTRDRAPVFTGSARPGLHVSVLSGETSLCAGTADASGRWRCQPQPLADGSYILQAQADDGAGHFSPPSPSRSLIVDTTPPAAPSFDPIPSPTNQSLIFFSGRGEAGATLSVTEAGSVLCQTVVAASGSWSCAASLPDGSHTVSATQTDAAGNQSAAASISFVIDTHVPPAPTLDAPVSPTSDPHVTLTGTGEAGDHLFVLDSFQHLICSALVGSDGKWSCTPAPFADGDYLLSAFQATAAGNRSPASTQRLLSVRTLLAPLFDPPLSPTRNPLPLFSGSAQAGVNVSVLLGETPLCTAVADGSGKWSCTPSSPLVDGMYLLVAQVTDGNGHSSGPSAARSLIVDTTPPAPPVFDPIPSPTNQSHPIFSGRGEAGASLSVTEAGALLCQTTVAASALWSCSAALPDGTHTVSATQTDAAGNMSDPSSISFVIDTHLPDAPTLDAPISPTSNPNVTLTGTGEAGDALTVLDSLQRLICSTHVGSDGKWSCTPPPFADGDYLLSAFQTSAVGNRSGPSAARLLSVRTLLAPLFDAPVSPTRNPTPTFTGTAQAAASVSVLIGEAPLCSGVADASGHWHCAPSAPLGDGAYLLLAQVTDGNGHASGPSAQRSLVVDTTPPAPPVLDNPPSPTRKHRPMLSGTAEAQSSVAVTDADSGEVLCHARANGAGAFSCAPGADLSAGTHRFSATATDAAGNVSKPAVPVTATISDNVPTPPRIISPSNGAQVEDKRPLIFGRTEQGTSVQVTLDGSSYAAQVDGSGNWMLVPPAPLALGMHHVSAAATDAQANVSDPAAETFSRVETGFARGGCASGGVPGPVLALIALLVALPRRRARLLALFALAAIPAAAQTPSMDLSIFRPASGGDGFAAVEGARPPIQGESRLEARVWTDYAAHPLVFVSETGSHDVLIRSRTGGFFGLQAHLLGPLSLAAQVPITYDEQGSLASLPPSSRGPGSLVGGFGDIRLTPRLALLRQEWAGVDLAAQTSLELPTARAQTLTDDGRVRWEGLIALGRRVWEGRGSLDLIGNAFVRLRPPHEFLDVRMGNEAGLRAGLGYLPPLARAWLPRRVYGEMEGRTFLRSGFAAGSSPAEWRVGATVCPVRSVALDFAGGGALTNGVGTPRARFLFAIGWSPSSCAQNAVAPLASVAPPPAPAKVAPPAPAVAAVPPPPEPPKMAAAPTPPPLPDRDGDGIPDEDDVCPDQPGPPENHGCPTWIKQLVIVSATRIDILEQVLFPTGKARIDPRSFRLLDQVAAVLLSHPDLLLVQVEGHTDNTGNPLRNFALSQARAQSVVAYLMARGVPAERLRAAGFGDSQPIDTNTTAKGRSANRRVAFKVLQTRSRAIEAARSS